MTFYRLRPGEQHPAFRPGETYPLLETTYPEGYVFVELHGERRCIDTRRFERVEGVQPVDA